MKTFEMNDDQKSFVKIFRDIHPDSTTFTRKEILNVMETSLSDGGKSMRYWPLHHEAVSSYRIGKNQYQFPMIDGTLPFPEKYGMLVKTEKKVTAKKVVNRASQIINKDEIKTDTMVENVTRKSEVVEYENLVPSVDGLYVNFGYHNDVKTIVKSGRFFPIFITGLSGNGKTVMVEQVSAQTKREVMRVNVTEETDEDDLIGGFRLVDGNTVWHDGPVIECMKRGAILLLDEIDKATSKIMCLQSVLEGKGVYVKKINQWVEPTDGFNVIATANTKGKGSETGNFVSSRILDEAFLERFSIVIEQEYPSAAIEKKILTKVFESQGFSEMGEFINFLTRWAQLIRELYMDGGISDVITTRRLIHIANTYSIFGDKEKAVRLPIARFDDETKLTFMELYSKVDAEINAAPEETVSSSETTDSEDVVSENDEHPF